MLVLWPVLRSFEGVRGAFPFPFESKDIFRLWSGGEMVVAERSENMLVADYKAPVVYASYIRYDRDADPVCLIALDMSTSFELTDSGISFGRAHAPSDVDTMLFSRSLRRGTGWSSPGIERTVSIPRRHGTRASASGPRYEARPKVRSCSPTSLWDDRSSSFETECGTGQCVVEPRVTERPCIEDGLPYFG